MKRSKIILTISLALGLGAAATIAGFNLNAQEVQAGTGSEANTHSIFVGCWNEVNFASLTADCGIYEYTDENEDGTPEKEKFIDATRIGSAMFSATLDTTYAKFIIVRIYAGESFATSKWEAQISHNQTVDLDVDGNYSFYVLEGWTGEGNETITSNKYATIGDTQGDNKDKYNGYVMAEGNRYYFDAYNVRDWWYNDGYKTYIVAYGVKTFYNVYSEMWVEMERIPNTDIFSYTMPHGFIAYNFDIVRASEGNWAHKANQTWSINDLSDLGYIAIYNEYEIDDKTVQRYKYGFSHCSNDAMLYNLFSNYFLSLQLCKDEGGLKDGASDLWTKATATYNSILDLLVSKKYIVNANPAEDPMMARYVAVIAKNDGYADFMDKGVSYQGASIGYLTSINESSINKPMIIMIGAFVAVLAIGAGALIMKRRSAE